MTTNAKCAGLGRPMRPVGLMGLALAAVTVATTLFGGCTTLQPEEARPHDQRLYVTPTNTSFEALPGAPATHRWAGVLDAAAYQIEVPQQGWNGQLVMWTHGYAGTGPKLIVNPPLMRRHLLARGYAWAASSYSKNHYDVRAGVEDTNALALAFSRLAAGHGVALAQPQTVFIAGVSMGGHIAAAAVERETLASARNKQRYAGALPLCGVLADTELSAYFGAYQFAAMQLAEQPARSFPVMGWSDVLPAVKSALFSDFPKQRTPAGEQLRRLVMNLTGGARPFFEEGFDDKGLQDTVWGTFGSDGTYAGVLNSSAVDTRPVQYRFGEMNAPLTAAELSFNQQILRAAPLADVNRPRRDGLRWVPLLHGEFDVPVLSLHTLGDLYVPFKMQQAYLQRASAKGRDKLLVQRAIRDVGHCAFTAAEAATAFDDLAAWVADGRKPMGDDVMSPQVLAAPDYGCRFTDNRPSPQDYAKADKRSAAQANYAACAAQKTAQKTTP
jgi:acetyl esterase/lipase